MQYCFFTYRSSLCSFLILLKKDLEGMPWGQTGHFDLLSGRHQTLLFLYFLASSERQTLELSAPPMSTIPSLRLRTRSTDRLLGLLTPVCRLNGSLHIRPHLVHRVHVHPEKRNGKEVQAGDDSDPKRMGCSGFISLLVFEEAKQTSARICTIGRLN